MSAFVVSNLPIKLEFASKLLYTYDFRLRILSGHPIIEKVTTEGAEIYCERRGNGPFLLLIAGAMGGRV
jgi:hypothetical protein